MKSAAVHKPVCQAGSFSSLGCHNTLHWFCCNLSLLTQQPSSTQKLFKMQLEDADLQNDTRPYLFCKLWRAHICRSLLCPIYGHTTLIPLLLLQLGSLGHNHMWNWLGHLETRVCLEVLFLLNLEVEAGIPHSSWENQKCGRFNPPLRHLWFLWKSQNVSCQHYTLTFFKKVLFSPKLAHTLTLPP